ncbi:MAG: permease [Bradymonadales bacterium]
MDWSKEWKKLALLMAVFLGLYYLPIGSARFDNAVMEALHLAKWYAQEHVILCLIPAFFIAGAISVFISHASVMKYLGAKANRFLAYAVASVSGSILSVCSCTVLPMFAGIYRMGAGLGPATAFLYSGPAINVLAIILTGSILGLELGIARAVGAVLFSIVIGVLMELIFRKDKREQQDEVVELESDEDTRPLWKNGIFFASLLGILVFANWGEPDGAENLWAAIHSIKWLITALFAIILAVALNRFFKLAWWKLALVAIPTGVLAYIFRDSPVYAFSAAVIGFSIITSTDKGESSEWFSSSWDFAKLIMPLLFVGVLLAGALLGRVGHEGLIPSEWVEQAVGGNSLWANFFASFAGAFMYFATLTEVPILEGLIGNGMGKGPALALLLSGPALSLPNMLVIRSVLGTRKTVVFVALVIVMASFSGYIFGTFWG